MVLARRFKLLLLLLLLLRLTVGTRGVGCGCCERIEKGYGGALGRSDLPVDSSDSSWMISVVFG
jgi:hypothetical protein